MATTPITIFNSIFLGNTYRAKQQQFLEIKLSLKAELGNQTFKGTVRVKCPPFFTHYRYYSSFGYSETRVMETIHY